MKIGGLFPGILRRPLQQEPLEKTGKTEQLDRVRSDKSDASREHRPGPPAEDAYEEARHDVYGLGRRPLMPSPLRLRSPIGGGDKVDNAPASESPPPTDGPAPGDKIDNAPPSAPPPPTDGPVPGDKVDNAPMFQVPPPVQEDEEEDEQVDNSPPASDLP